MLIRQRECHFYYRDVHYYVIIIIPRPLPSGYDASRRDEMFIFRRSRIEVESQCCNSRLRWVLHGSFNLYKSARESLT